MNIFAEIYMMLLDSVQCENTIETYIIHFPNFASHYSKSSGKFEKY